MLSTDLADVNNKQSGYLMKKSTAGDWQKRYFETNGNFLTYYKSQKMSKLLAALSLPQVGEISMCSNGESCTFQLDLKDRQYILKATTPEEAQSWVDTLVLLRDGGGVPAGKNKSATATPTKGEAPSGGVDPNEGIVTYPSPKTEALDPANEGVFVKQNRDMDASDQCAAGCTIS
jgi:hypothetical protein